MRRSNRNQAGFTLVEALIAMVVLAFGLTAVANLFVTASSSNGIGNRQTATAAEATEVMERLKAIPFTTLCNNLACAGGVVNDATTATCGGVCAEASANSGACVAPGTFALCRNVTGVGQIRTRWQIQLAAQAPNQAGTIRPIAYFLTVESQAVGPFGSQISQSVFSTLRSCTSAGC